MASRYAEMVRTEIDGAPDQIAADCSRGKLAAYFVRQGRGDEARVILRELHSRYDPKPTAAISAWIHLINGIELSLIGMQAAAHDKIQRAHALSVAASLRSMRSLSAGWLANLKFGVLDVDGMILRLLEAFEYATQGDHDALARASLVCAVSLHFADRFDLAKPWYGIARRHAAEESDDGMVSALMHNLTCMGVASLRKSTLTGTDYGRYAPDPFLEAESTINYDGLVGTASASTWAPILKAQAAALGGKSALALQIYEECIDIGKAQGMDRVMCYMYADMAWCYLQVGSTDKGRQYMELAEASFLPTTLVDDRAATHSRLAASAKLLERAADSQRHAELATENWAALSRIQCSIVERARNIQFPGASS